MKGLDVFPGSEGLVRELIERHRFKVERVRDSEGRLVEGEWHFPCKTGAVIYQYDAHTWGADLLTTYWHNRLIREFGTAMTFFGEPAEIAKAYDPDDEHTLHFPSDLILHVARLLKVKRRARRTDKQRQTAARLIRAYNKPRKQAAGQVGARTRSSRWEALLE